MLSCRDLSIAFGPSVLFSHVSFDVARRERVALLGPNGGGKSTLLKIIAGELSPDSGRVSLASSSVEVGFLPQVEWDDRERSAGQRQKGRLAGVLGSRPNLLLLDEPTNHLDADAVGWVVGELLEYPGAVLFSCHDRDVVQRVATRVLYLERGRLKSYDGGYDGFLAQRGEEERVGRRHYESWAQEHERLRVSADRQRRWADTAHRQAGERNPYGKKRAAKMMQHALAAESRLVRHESERVEKPWEAPPFSFAFLPPKRLPPILVRLDEVHFAYSGGRGVGPVTFEVRRGERLRLAGPNGSGKTTILRLLAGARDPALLPPGTMAGRVAIHPEADIRLFDPASPLPDAETPVALMLGAGAPDAALARTLLGLFGIRGDLAVGPVAHLSPGEQVRLRAVLLLVRGADVLLMDEPTNHLDLEGQTALQAALGVYPGTAVVASHDRSFYEPLGPREVVVGRVRRERGRTDTKPSRDGAETALLEMRLAVLTARLGSAAHGEREGVEKEIAEVVRELRAKKGGAEE